MYRCKIIFAISLFILPFSGFGQYPFLLKGSTTSALNGKKIYLTIWDMYSENRYQKKDTATIKDGVFYFKGTINKASENAKLYTIQPSGNLDFVLDTGFNHVQLLKLPPKTPFYKNILSNPRFRNSASNKIRHTMDSLTNLYYFTKGRPSQQFPGTLEIGEEDKVKLIQKKLDIIRKYPDVYYSLISLFSLSEDLTSKDLEMVFTSLNEQVRNSGLGAEFSRLLAKKKRSEIGSKIQAFTAMTDSDLPFHSDSLSGSPYLLAFGATWCLPCKKKLPLLRQLNEKYKGNGFRIVYVNLDEKMEKWKSQVIQDKMNWLNISENVKWEESKISQLLNVTALPLYLIVDKNGTILYNEFQLKDNGNSLLEQYIQKSIR